jgi:L-alanine-DL-glutamate epimerase-like enolase superfamily enzyme
MRDSEPPIYKNVTITGLDCIDEDGLVSVPEGPGLGIEYDWDFIASHAAGHIEVT